MFLLEDTDTIPERHAFLGNYRRYCCQIIEAIVLLTTRDAISYILGRTDDILQHLYDGLPPLDSMFSLFFKGRPADIVIRTKLFQALDAGPPSGLAFHCH